MAAKRSPPRMLTVVKKERPCDGIIRVIFGGEELIGFPEDKNGAHIKLFFPRPHQTVPVLPTLGSRGPVWPPADEKPVVRTYSVRYFSACKQQLAVEFVDHAHGGTASQWAQNAQIGDQIGLAGPGGPDPLLAPAPWNILVGDLSAFPAMSAIIEDLPRDRTVDAFLLCHGNANLTCSIPEGINVRYLSDSLPVRDVLFEVAAVITERRVGNGSTVACSAWVAGENQLVVQTRDFLKNMLGLTKREMYAIPYWRNGQDEEQYHQQRHTIMDEVY